MTCHDDYDNDEDCDDYEGHDDYDDYDYEDAHYDHIDYDAVAMKILLKNYDAAI